MTHNEAKTLTKAELAINLANARCKAFPAIYAGHYADALVFVKREWPTKRDMLLAGATQGLWGYEWQG